MEKDCGETFDATAIRGLADGTLHAYGRHLNRLQREAEKKPNARARSIVEEELLSLFNRCHTAAGIRQLLSGLRLVEKMDWIQPVVRRADWLLVETVARMQEHSKAAENRCWASMDSIIAMAEMASTFQDWEVVGLAAASAGLLLRVSEATTVHLVDHGGVTKAQFEGTKSRRGTNVSAVGRWTKKWLQFVAFWRASHGHHPDRPASFSGVAGLHRALRELLAKGGGRCAHIRWHGFRRFGAAQLQGLGLPMSSIQVYGGWGSAAIAQLYTRAPTGWELVREGPMPCPKIVDKKASTECTEDSSFAMFPRWIHKEVVWAEASTHRKPRGEDRPTARKRARTAGHEATVISDSELD